MKKLVSLSLTALSMLTLVGCGGEKTSASEQQGTSAGPAPVEKTRVEKAIADAETLSWKDLYKKARDELDGQEWYACGNTSRGQAAMDAFIKCLQGQKYADNHKDFVENPDYADFKTYKPNFTAKSHWQNQTGGQIYDFVDADIKGANLFNRTLIQNANDLQAKEIETGHLLNFVPKEYKEAAPGESYSPLGRERNAKVFRHNNADGKQVTNRWEFTTKGFEFMDFRNETVGRNFLIRLTKQEHASVVKKAYDALPAGDLKNAADEALKYVRDKKIAKLYKVDSTDGEYALAWDKLVVENNSYNNDDGPIRNALSNKSNAGKNGLLVYSKLRKITESKDASVNNVDVVAYNPNYIGVGGYSYKHYCQIFKNAKYPYAACAFSHFITCTKDGFYAWGKDMGCYPINSTVGIDHSKSGQGWKIYNPETDQVDKVIEAKTRNDKGWSYWKDKLVEEEPEYSSGHAGLAAWFTTLKTK